MAIITILMVIALISMNAGMKQIRVRRICDAKTPSELSFATVKQDSIQLKETVRTLMNAFLEHFSVPSNQAAKTRKVAMSVSALKAMEGKTAVTWMSALRVGSSVIRFRLVKTPKEAINVHAMKATLRWTGAVY